MAIKEVTAEEYEKLKLNIGKLDCWDEKPFLEAANILVAGDEPLRAMHLLRDCVPGYYRDHMPESFRELISDIEVLLCTPTFYMTNKYDAMVRADDADFVVLNTYRGKLIEQDIKELNAAGKTPHLVDLGPGEYWLPIGLSKLGYDFSYKPIGLCAEALTKAMPFIEKHLRDPRPDQPGVFVACELIEHLHNEADIRVEFMKEKRPFKHIHISTPKYSFDGQKDKLSWRSLGDLGHLRTYTPSEFQRVVLGMFPEYDWAFGDDQIMHLKGTRK